MTDRTELIEEVARVFDVPVDLLTMTRKHDLPPRWDGLPVTWRGWEDEVPMFICPPPKIPPHCERCGSVERPRTNRGTVAPQDEQVTVVAGIILYAFRCPDCVLDTVMDMTADECWTLDYTDYGDEGSVPPDPTPPPTQPAPRQGRPKTSNGRAAFAAARAELQAAKNQETLL